MTLQAIKAFFSAPVFPNEETNHQAALLSFLINLHIAIGLSTALMLIVFTDTETLYPLAAFISILPGFGLRVLMRKGHVTRASIFFISLIFLLMPAVAWFSGSSVASVSVTVFQTITIVMAGLLLGGGGAAIFVALTGLVNATLIYAELNYNYVTSTSRDPISIWFMQVISFAAIAAMLYITNRQVRASFARARDSEQRYRGLLENIPVITYIVAVDHPTQNAALYLSPQSAQLTGYTFEEIASDPNAWLNMVHPADRERVIAEGERTDLNGEPFDCEYRVISKNQRTFWFHDRSVLVKDDQGRPIYRVGVWTDVTERKEAETALRKSEDRLRAILENSTDLIFEVDHAGQIILINRLADVYLSKNVHTLVPSEYTQVVNEAIAKVFETGEQLALEIQTLTPDGRASWDSIRIGPILTDGKVTSLTVSSTEITERKLAELAQQQSEALYRRAIAAAGAVPYVLDHATHTLTFIGDGILAMTGYSAAEMMSTAGLWNTVVLESIPSGALAHLTYEEANRLTDADNSLPWECDFLIRTREGQLRWIADTSVKSFDEKSEHLLSIGIKQDITDRKQTEAALLKSASRLELLHNIDRALLSAQSPAEIARDALTRIRQLIPSQRTSITLFDFEKNEAAFLVASFDEAFDPAGQSVVTLQEYGQYIIAELLQDKACRVDDVLTDPRCNELDRALAKDGFRSWLYLPLFSQGQLIGGLNFGRAAGNPFTVEEEAIAHEVANQLAIVLKQNQLHESLQTELAERKLTEAKLRASEERLAILHDIDRALLSASSPREIAKKTLARIRQLITSPRASVTLFNFATQQAFFLAADLDEGGSIWDTPVTFEEYGEYVIAEIRHNKPFIMNDVLTDPRANELDIRLAQKDGIHSWLYLPLLYQGELIGALNLGRGHGAHFTPEDAAAAQDIANQLAIAVQQTRLYEALQVELTERQRAEAEARRLEQLYRRAIDAAGAVPYVIDHAERWNYVFIGEGILAITGYTAAEITSDLWDSMRLQAVPRGRLAQLTFEEADRWTNADASILWECDFLIRTRAGQTRWVADTSVKTRDDKSGKWLSIGIYQDITERKLVEERIKQLNLELEQRVRERTAQLEAANKELEAFSYSVSHDLRAPLRAINSFSAIIKNDFAAGLDPQARHFLGRVIESGEKMNQLIDGLLNFSRLNRKTLSTQSVDVNALVRSIIESLAPETAGRQIEWNLAELPPAQADPLLLQQVFANLIGNAVKYTGQRSQARIEIGYMPPPSPSGRGAGGEGVVYFVRDNGAGFDMQYADKLFGVFQRLHTEAEFEGTGIGLATVQRIIMRHGGRIWAEAAPDKGATFYFTLA